MARRQQRWDSIIVFAIGFAAWTFLSLGTGTFLSFWIIFSGGLLFSAAALGGLLYVGWRFPLVNADVVRRTLYANELADPPLRFPPRSPTYLLLLFTVFTSATHPAYRLRLGRLANVDITEPAVFAPGETVRVLVDKSLTSADGEWGGVAEVELLNADAFENPPRLEWYTRPIPMAEIMSFDRESTPRPIKTFVAIEIPRREDLIGRSLELRLRLNLTAPQQIDGDEFEYQQIELERDRTIVIANSSQAALDFYFWLTAYVALLAAFLAGAWALWRFHLLKQILPLVGTLKIQNLDEAQAE